MKKSRLPERMRRTKTPGLGFKKDRSRYDDFAHPYLISGITNWSMGWKKNFYGGWYHHLTMPAVALLLLFISPVMAQNEVLVGTSYSYKSQQEQSIGFHVLFNEDQYDAFAGYEGKVNLFETHTDFLLGWQLSSHDALRVYAGMSLGFTLYNEKYTEEERYKDWFCYEFTGGIRYYSFLCPYIEFNYGATFIRAGIDIDLVQTIKLIH